MRMVHWFRHRVIGGLLRRWNGFLYPLAYCWRRMLVGTTFIAITGSLGKTTTKELLAAILASEGRTYRSIRNQNGGFLVALNILRVRPWHRYAVLEVGSRGPGGVARAGRLISPDAAVITGVAGVHIRSYPSLEEIAAEKLQLLEFVRPGGFGAVNGDDPLLARARTVEGIRLRRFGSAPSLDLRLHGSASTWPGSLSLELGESVGEPIETCLHGTHWAPSVLAALLVGRECGVSLDAMKRAIAGVPPFDARMQPVRLPSGAVVMRDEYNGTPASFEAALDWFEKAEAPRKILIAGDFSDHKGKIRTRLRRLGRRAARVCDHAVFVGPHAHHSESAAVDAKMPSEKVASFPSLRGAAPYVQALLKEGDLVLLKSRTTDHFSRLLYAQVGEVKCWKSDCAETFLCDICGKLGLSRSERGSVKRIR